MASKTLPAAKERRRMLAEGPGNLGRTGQEFLAAGRWAEAQECLEAAGDRQGLADLASQALEAGDFFAWRQAKKALGEEPDEVDLTRLAERAHQAGKLAHAASAQALLKPKNEHRPS